VLHVYGSLFYAAATAFERGLPSADEARGAVAILIVRERPEIGSTLIGVLRRYSEALRSRGGQLMLAGVSPELYDQLARTGMVGILGEENLFRGQPQLGAAMNEALAAAREWRRRER
jgi:SulP family sulfate permease